MEKSKKKKQKLLLLKIMWKIVFKTCSIIIPISCNPKAFAIGRRRSFTGCPSFLLNLLFALSLFPSFLIYLFGWKTTKVGKNKFLYYLNTKYPELTAELPRSSEQKSHRKKLDAFKKEIGFEEDFALTWRETYRRSVNDDHFFNRSSARYWIYVVDWIISK